MVKPYERPRYTARMVVKTKTPTDADSDLGYRIVAGQPDSLETLVSGFLRNGWHLYGYPMLGKKGQIYQAMVRDAPLRSQKWEGSSRKTR